MFIRKLSGLILLLFLSVQAVFSQASVYGPTCVHAGVEYQYNISGSWEIGSTVQVCITGGLILDNDSTCISDTAISFLRVIWDSASASRSISVESGTITGSITIETTTNLTGGIIDTLVRNQYIDSNTQPSAIICSVATGGTCNPSYSYQWEISSDNMSWTDIENATAQSLVFGAPLTQSFYYRRRTLETNSQSIAYSDVAAVFVNP